MGLLGRVKFGPFRVDGQLLIRDQRTIHLRPKAWELLCYLLERPGVLVSHDELLRHLWGATAIQPQALTRLIFELRGVLEKDSAIRIENIARRGYRFIAEVEVEGQTVPRTAATPVQSTPLTQLIGRAADIRALDACWGKALGGHRQLVFVGGEAGIGKTTLVNQFLSGLRLQDSPSAPLVACGQCPRLHGEAEPYMAVLDALQRLGETCELTATLRRFAPAWLVQMPWLIAADEANSLRQALDGIGEARMLREGIRLFEALSADQPLVLALEDLHWSDTATIDLVRALGERSTPARLLVIGTYRSTDVALSPHPLREAVSHLVHRSGAATRLVLDSLGPLGVHTYLAERFGDDDLARVVAPVIERKSGGNPLFLRSLTDCLVGDGTIVREQQAWVLSVPPERLEVALPDGLREIIGEQLMLLPQDRSELLEAASAAGEEFTAHELAAALLLAEDEVESACVDLAQRGQFIRHVGERPWPDGSRVQAFALTHALYAQVLSERIAPLHRRVLHARIGERLESAYGAQAIEIAVRLASLFEAAGKIEKQASYFELAALRAYQRFAYRETIECITQAINAIRMLPATPARVRREAERWLDLGNISIVAYGFNDHRARGAFDRSWELARDGFDPLLAFRAQLGRCLTELMAFANEGRSADELLQLARSVLELAQDGHPELLCAAHMYNAFVFNAAGLFNVALEHCVSGRRHLAVAVPNIPRDADTEVTLAIVQARSLTSLGRIADSRDWSARALARLTALSLPQQKVAGNALLAEAALARRDDDLARELASTAIAIASESGGGNYLSLSRAVLACTQLHSEADALQALERELQARRSVGERWCETPMLMRLSAFHRQRGDFEGALRRVDEAVLLNEPQFTSDLWREHGEILHARARTAADGAATGKTEAEEQLRKALALARQQAALLYEGRAAVALGRLLIDTQRRAEAFELISDVHRRFPPVVDSQDLNDLEALLRELEG